MWRIGDYATPFLALFDRGLHFISVGLHFNFHHLSCLFMYTLQTSKLSSPKTEELSILYPLWKEAVVLKTTNWLCKDSQPAGSLIAWLGLTIYGFCSFRSWLHFHLQLPFNDYISICSFHSKYISVEGRWKLHWPWRYVHEYDYMVKPVCTWQSFGNNLQ